MADVRLTQLDGKLPNLALMRLSAFHRDRGDRVHFYRTPYRQLGEPDYATVYGGAIFDFTAERVATFKKEFPDAIIGGTWNHKPGEPYTGPVVEDIVGGHDRVDYTHWPSFTASIGFSQRGCRFNCAFCGVPTMEGKVRPVSSVERIWRGGDYPRHVHLLDNDFFGQHMPELTAKEKAAKTRAFKAWCASEAERVIRQRAVLTNLHGPLRDALVGPMLDRAWALLDASERTARKMEKTRDG